MKKIILAIVMLFSISLFAQEYTVDKVHSKVSFKVKHLMISNVVGYFEEFKGTYDYDAKTGMLKSLLGEVAVESINTSNAKRDNDLRSSNFFEVSKFPLMKFKFIKLSDDDLYAYLTIKGVTKKVKFEYENGGSIKDPWGKNRSAFSIEGKISRKEFGIVYNKLLEAGGVMVGDKIKISIEIEGISNK